jgi:hypothetical protein
MMPIAFDKHHKQLILIFKFIYRFGLKSQATRSVNPVAFEMSLVSYFTISYLPFIHATFYEIEVMPIPTYRSMFGGISESDDKCLRAT